MPATHPFAEHDVHLQPACHGEPEVSGMGYSRRRRVKVLLHLSSCSGTKAAGEPHRAQRTWRTVRARCPAGSCEHRTRACLDGVPGQWREPRTKEPYGAWRRRAEKRRRAKLGSTKCRDRFPTPPTLLIPTGNEQNRTEQKKWKTRHTYPGARTPSPRRHHTRRPQPYPVVVVSPPFLTIRPVS